MAELKEGNPDPQHVPCKIEEGASYTAGAKFEATSVTHNVTTYIGTNDCTGDNSITGVLVYDMEGVSSEGDSQILKISNHYYSYTIKGDALAYKMNQLKVCGHDTWQAKLYKSTDSMLQSCTEDNGYNLLPPYLAPDAHANTLTRFRVVGKGMAVETRDATDENSEFAWPMYLTPKTVIPPR